ncbi:unnamed protein product [Polarella glacialis]|uniref:SnoaL-like domain-containing protein n=1 Tax=Polarella glacialis TaxID=89957 RepID=A0A813LC64_POLGL|nr:unnamed protein product [Polarella glacialis]
MEGYSSMEVPSRKPAMPFACVAALGLAALAGTVAIATMGVPNVRSVLPAATEPTKPVVRDTAGGSGSLLAKQAIVGMTTIVGQHIAWNDWKPWSVAMAPFWADDFTYDFNYVGPWNLGPTRGLRAWYEGEHLHINAAFPDTQWQEFLCATTNTTATLACYGLVQWTGEFAGVPPPKSHPKVMIRDLDFYVLEGKRIKINWCLIDVVDLFEQVGYQVVPKGPLKSEGYRAPNAMDGLPAPSSSMFTKEDAARSEQVWQAALHDDYDLGTGEGKWWAENLNWYGPGGVGTAHSREDYVKHWLKPLRAAFSNLERSTDLVVCEGPYCGAHFYMWGTHTGEWMGEKPTGKRVPIRCGAHARVVDGKIVEGWLIADIPRAFHAMGVDFFGRAREMAVAQAAAEESHSQPSDK